MIKRPCPETWVWLEPHQPQPLLQAEEEREPSVCLSRAFPPRSSAGEHDSHSGGGAVGAGAVRRAGGCPLPVQASAER